MDGERQARRRQTQDADDRLSHGVSPLRLFEQAAQYAAHQLARDSARPAGGPAEHGAAQFIGDLTPDRRRGRTGGGLDSLVETRRLGGLTGGGGLLPGMLLWVGIETIRHTSCRESRG